MRTVPTDSTGSSGCPGGAAAGSRRDTPTSPAASRTPNGWLYLAAGLAVVASIALILAAYLTH